ncbi:hypothetical protein ACF0H5_019336 [Mactra antiquata]
MKTVVWLNVLLILVCKCHCQSSTLVVNVIEVTNYGNITLACNVSPTVKVTRWAYLYGSTGTALMTFQNGICTMLPSNTFLSNSRYSYTCNNSVHEVIIHASKYISMNNYIVDCRDATQPDRTGSAWLIKIIQDGGTCSYCEPTITFDVIEVNEGDNVTFVCRVSSNVSYVNWNVNFGSHTAAMGVQNGQCTTLPSLSFLDNITEYVYTCNNTVYQITKLNVQGSDNNDMYMCTPPFQLEGKGSNWIIKVKGKS